MRDGVSAEPVGTLLQHQLRSQRRLRERPLDVQLGWCSRVPVQLAGQLQRQSHLAPGGPRMPQQPAEQRRLLQRRNVFRQVVLLSARLHRALLQHPDRQLSEQLVRQQRHVRERHQQLPMRLPERIHRPVLPGHAQSLSEPAVRERTLHTDFVSARLRLQLPDRLDRHVLQRCAGQLVHEANTHLTTRQTCVTAVDCAL